MATSPVHQDWPRPSCREQYRDQEKEASVGRDTTTTNNNNNRIQRWENISKWTDMTLSEAVQDRQLRRLEEASCQLCGAPTVSKTTGLIMMIMV